MEAGVVYLITCQSCGKEYIGETGRPLCVRIKEHLDGLRKSKSNTPLGAHRREDHSDQLFNIAVTILTREPEVIPRKTLEAFWITSKAPAMNRKEEGVVMNSELISYQSLCGFDLH